MKAKLIVACLVLSSVALLGESGAAKRGTLEITVTDRAMIPIANSTLVVRSIRSPNIHRQIRTKLLTNDAGIASVSLLAGHYEVTASWGHFDNRVKILVRPGRTRKCDVVLPITLNVDPILPEHPTVPITPSQLPDSIPEGPARE